MAEGNVGGEAETDFAQPIAHRKDDLACEVKRKQSLRARYLYGFIFFATNLLAWFVRDYGHAILAGSRYSRVCGVQGENCFHVRGILRVSFGCFMFFLFMFATTFGARKLNQLQNSWHSSWWTLKFFLYLMSMIAAYIVPSNFIHIYGEVARVGGGIFLLLQLISFNHFITWFDCHWMPYSQPMKCGCIGLFLSTLFYSASFCGLALLHVIYSPHGSCIINEFFIAFTAVLVNIMMIVSLHSKVNRGLLSSGIMCLYIVFLCWSAIQSEPAAGRSHSMSMNVDGITILSFLLAICAIALSTFSMGIDSDSFQFTKREIQTVDDIPYKYELFHFIFSTGAMYFAMLFISWDLDHPTKKWSIDVGWASTWVKVINECFAVCIYLWKLISPTITKNTSTDHQEHIHPIDDSV